MIPGNLIEEIRNKADIVALVSEYVKLKKTGRNYVGLCPFHPERTPSFTVSPEKQLFHCFGCGEGGNIFAFLMKSENISFAESVKEVGEKLNIAVGKISVSSAAASKTEKDKLYEVMQLATNFFQSELAGDSGSAAREYLKLRGISDETTKTFTLGAAPASWDRLFKHLISRGVSPALIERAGLTLPREQKDGYFDRFRNRLIFPVFDLRGRTIAFSGRSLKNEEPKYMNSPETGIYHKGESIFGLTLTKEFAKAAKSIILVEGNVDLVTLYQAGFQNVAAPLGTALTVAQCKLLARFASEVILAFDSDSAGGTATDRSVELLRSQNLKVKVVNLGSAKDPDELIRTQGGEAFAEVILNALPFLEFKIKRALAKYKLSEIEDRARATREVINLLAIEPDEFIQREYVKMTATLLRLDQETLLSEIKKRQYYRSEQVKDLRRVTEKPASRLAEAEKSLIALALQKNEWRDRLKAELPVESFRVAEAKAVAEVLLATDFTGVENPAHFLLENLPTEETKKYLSMILVGENPQEPERVFNDCLQTVKTEGLKEKINGIKLELQTAEQAGDMEKATSLLISLKNEIS